MLDANEEQNNAIVTWQGKPYNIPSRHVRGHVGFMAALMQSSASKSEKTSFLFFADCATMSSVNKATATFFSFPSGMVPQLLHRDEQQEWKTLFTFNNSESDGNLNLLMDFADSLAAKYQI